jgi:CheY-like chemotaxis protein
MYTEPLVMDDSQAVWRVVIVEDDDRSRSALRAILEQEGFLVACAGDGDEGVDLVRTFRPDIVVLDLVLPNLNGFDAADLLKRDPATASIPLVAMTASWLGSESERLRRIGFDRALRKPFPVRALIEELRSVLRS